MTLTAPVSSVALPVSRVLFRCAVTKVLNRVIELTRDPMQYILAFRARTDESCGYKPMNTEGLLLTFLGQADYAITVGSINGERHHSTLVPTLASITRVLHDAVEATDSASVAHFVVALVTRHGEPTLVQFGHQVDCPIWSGGRSCSLAATNYFN